jgi:hypothetical protein
MRCLKVVAACAGQAGCMTRERERSAMPEGR